MFVCFFVHVEKGERREIRLYTCIIYLCIWKISLKRCLSFHLITFGYCSAQRNIIYVTDNNIYTDICWHRHIFTRISSDISIIQYPSLLHSTCLIGTPFIYNLAILLVLLVAIVWAELEWGMDACTIKELWAHNETLHMYEGIVLLCLHSSNVCSIKKHTHAPARTHAHTHTHTPSWESIRIYMIRHLICLNETLLLATCPPPPMIIRICSMYHKSHMHTHRLPVLPLEVWHTGNGNKICVMGRQSLVYCLMLNKANISDANAMTVGWADVMISVTWLVTDRRDSA